MANPITNPTQGNRAGLLTAADVAGLLSCSTRSVYRLSDAGRMPRPLKIGGMVRWSAAAVDAWLLDDCPDCRAAEVRATRTAKNPQKNHAGPTAQRG